MDDVKEARARVGPKLAIILAAVAQDKGCTEDQLSVGLVRELENYGLACCLDGRDWGWDAAHEEPTIKTLIIPPEDDPGRGGGQLPSGV